MTSLKYMAALGLATIAFAAPAIAQAQYPSQPIRMIVPYAPGGSVDAFARIVTPGLSQELGQPVVIENVAGAGGIIGVTRVVQAKPDGHTILMGIVSDVVIAPLVQSTAKYTHRDLTPIAPLGTSGLGVVANPKLGIRSFSDLIVRAKAEPGKLSYGATGAGSLPAIAMESFKKVTGTQMAFIPYASASKIATDVIGGNLDLAVSGLPALLEYVKAGRVTAVGVMSKNRDTGNPDIASASETRELKGMDFYFWTGIFAPANTPQPIVARVNAAFTKVMSNADVQARLKALGVDVSPATTPADYAMFVAASHSQWQKTIKDVGIPKQ